ncbi:RES family NAD+ phosphorylase [Paraburkholderia sp. EG287A]|uniref:RES family NAD+ phosphorylase n=1 Tax=Paraburkholderia sp. EG287A TaxID=3237012 RepID=UPI0034D355CA
MKRYQNLFKALIRLHYSEWEYNGHMGGTDSVEQLFYQDNRILRWPMDALKLEPFLLEMLDDVYPEPDRGVSLFAGYDADGHQAGVLRSLQNESSDYVPGFFWRLQRENYWNVEKDAETALAPLLAQLVNVVPKDSRFWRARIGYRVRGQSGQFDGFVGYETFYSPYEEAAISSPPPIDCGAGRLNRHGESLLYLASDANTALAEVRPSTGQEVSLGRFHSTLALNVVDFTKLDIYDFCKNDKTLDNYIELRNLGERFSAAVPPNRRQQYSLTQLCAHLVRKLDYDGIVFQSSLAEGKNLVVFEPGNFTYEEDSGEVHHVTSVTVSTEPLKTYVKGEDYHSERPYA